MEIYFGNKRNEKACKNWMWWGLYYKDYKQKNS